jgi:hypothetical protein
MPKTGWPRAKSLAAALDPSQELSGADRDHSHFSRSIWHWSSPVGSSHVALVGSKANRRGDPAVESQDLSWSGSTRHGSRNFCLNVNRPSPSLNASQAVITINLAAFHPLTYFLLMLLGVHPSEHPDAAMKSVSGIYRYSVLGELVSLKRTQVIGPSSRIVPGRANFLATTRWDK